MFNESRSTRTTFKSRNDSDKRAREVFLNKSDGIRRQRSFEQLLRGTRARARAALECHWKPAMLLGRELVFYGSR